MHIMFNLGTGMKNATHLKNKIYFSMVLLSVGQHLSHWPTIKTLSPVRGKLLAELALKFSDGNHLFRSFDISLFDISWAFRNVVKMLLDNIRLYFIVNHHIRCSMR